MKRLLQKSKLCQWTMFLAVMCVGTVAGMMIVGEEDPDSPMTMGEFFLLKAAAFIAIYLCYRLFKHLYENGILPKYIIDELNKEEEI